MPSSIKPAREISQDQLQQELSKAAPPPQSAVVRDETPEPEKMVSSTQAEETAPDTSKPEKQSSKPILPGLMDKIKEGVMDKKDDKKNEPEAKPSKKVVSADDAPAPKKVDPNAPPEELAPEERGVLPHDSERVRKRINFFLSEDKKNKEALAKIKAELDEAKKAPATAANADEVAALKAEHDKLKEEALRLRRRYDWDNDTEVKTKYREPIEVAEKSVEDVFKRNNFGDSTLKAIKEAGGFAAFSRSRATYPVTVTDPDTQEKKTVNYTASELARSWLAGMPVADAEEIRQSVGRQELLKNEEKSAMGKAQEEAKTYYESMTSAQRKAHEEQQAALKKNAEEYDQWSKKTESETDWLKDVSIPDGASEEDRKSIEQENAFRKELREGMGKHPTNAIEYGKLKLEAAESRHLKRALEKHQARIDELEEQVKRGKSALKTTGKGGSLLVKDGHKPDAPKREIGSTDFMAAINSTMLKKAGAADDE
jgi:hypothetical protein